MTTYPLTPEQEKVIRHPLGQHARVLAVAGSGKSTTMAHRISALVSDHNVRPSSILVLMFNALARKQFIIHLDKIGLSQELQPPVHTFHSFSFHLINQMIKSGSLPAKTQFWLADKVELIWLTVKRAVNNLEKARRIPSDTVDPEEALSAISLWKGSLIPPERAGSYTSPYLPLVYAEFEAQRKNELALTFDDFVPLAIDILQSNPAIQQRYRCDLRHLIVDEYQDINYGQQHLLEILASSQVDVMVVGDDDQTIYEWRGARPNYILQDFANVFQSRTVLDYHLSRSFRFGPLIAQCAANVITCNTNRIDKPLIAFQPGKSGFIQVFHGGYDASKQLADQVLALTQVDRVPPKEIIVLARLYAQLDNLEAEFLSQHIPYRVDGQEPFFKRPEINTLLDYIRLGRDLQKPINESSGKWLMAVANRPSRMLSRSLLSRLVSIGKYQHLSIEQLLEKAVHDPAHGLSGRQSEQVIELWGFLETMQCRLQDPSLDAGGLLSWMVDELHYLDYFQDYYGQGEHADEKKLAVLNFIHHVDHLHIAPLSLLKHLAELDTTQGKPESEQIVFTTIFRVKGLEFDYVLLPQCDENLLPYLKGESNDIYDTQGLVRQNSMSSALECERRLFYVALTRARKGVLIGASNRPSRFLGEMLHIETGQVMDAVTGLSCGDPAHRERLLEALQNDIARPLLLRNLVEGYLPDMNETRLAARIQSEYTLPAVHAAVSSAVNR